MPLLDITATAQLQLHNHHSAALSLVWRDQPLASSSSSFIPGNNAAKPFKIPTHDFSLRCLKAGSSRGLIKSVATATVENMAVVRNSIFEEGSYDLKLKVDSEYLKMKNFSPNGESGELDEKERLRRNRISIANKGNTPWNKGRRHSPETIQKIKERTRFAMQNPKVKMKLTSLGHAQSQETKLKIGASVRIGWEKRRIKLKLQETCHFEWQNLIAESSRSGLLGQEELSWDSYRMLNEKLSKEWLQSVELRKKARKVKCDKRAPKSAEQKKRISQAISAKWNDPAYRNRVCSALANYHGITKESERKPKRKVYKKRPTRSVLPNPTDSDSHASKKKSPTSSSRPRRSKEPSYKDPLVSCKLEIIKNIRAKRVTEEARKTKAIEQARLLIAEAEEAADALEVAARTNPVAKASLTEARKLIKEARESIQSINVQSHATVAKPKNSSDDSSKPTDDVEQINRTDQFQKMNGCVMRAASDQKCTKLDTVNLHDMLDGREKLYPYISPTKHPQPLLGMESPNGNVIAPRSPSIPSDTAVKSQRSKKKWIRGRLVEVMECK